MADRRSVSRRRRAAERLITAVLTVGVVFGCAAWIRETRPAGLRQWAVPEVQLDQAQLADATAIPHYRDVIPVVTFHGVDEHSNGNYDLDLVRFTEHIKALRAAGFHSVDMQELADFAIGLPVDLPDRPVLLTFDDGHASDYLRVDPVLARYGFQATAFLITGSVRRHDQRSYYLDTDQVQALDQTGRWQFGGHTHALHVDGPMGAGRFGSALDHRLLVDGRAESHEEWRARVSGDLGRSQRFLRDSTRRGPAIAFAYPFGSFGQDRSDPAIEKDLPTLLSRQGYRVAFTGEQAEPALAVSAGDDPYHLHRLGVRADSTPEDLLRRLQRVIPTPMPADPVELPWHGDSATCDPRHGLDARPVLRVRAGPGYGFCVTDANTSHWRDYRLDADVTGATRKTAAVIRGRLVTGVTGHGNLEVTVGESIARVRETIGGRTRPLADLALPPPADGRDSRHVTVVFRGGTAEVRIDSAISVVRLQPDTDVGGPAFGVFSAGGGTVTLSGLRLTDLPDTDG